MLHEWCELKLSDLVSEGHLESVWWWGFLCHLNNPSLQSSIEFSPVATSSEVAYSGMGLHLFAYIMYGGSRSSRQLVAWRLSMLGYNHVCGLFISLVFFLYSSR